MSSNLFPSPRVTRRASGGVVRLVALLTLTGCTVGPNFEQPNWASPVSWFSGRKEPVRTPASVPVAEPINVNWWTLFNDPQLTKLERQVAADNLDVRLAGIRLGESRAQLGIARSAEFPTLSGNASYVRQQASNHGIFVEIPTSAGASGGFGVSTGGVQSERLETVRYLAGRLRCLVGSRLVGPGSALGRIRQCIIGSGGRGQAVGAAVNLG